jgi:hypothetical protein
MLIERMDNNFVKKNSHCRGFGHGTKKKQKKERNRRGERFRFGFYYHNRVVLN